MFGDPATNSKKWKVEGLSRCLINIENGKSFVCKNYGRKDEYPAILKLSAVTYGIYNSFENKALTDKNLFVKNVEVKKGDLLFTRKNTPELVGVSAYIYETPPNLMMPDLIFRLNTNEKCNKIYLWKLINHDLFRKNIKALSNGSAKSMSNISKHRLMSLNIPIPPKALQNQFADFVRQVDKLKFEMEKSLKKLEDNFNSLMQKAFNGELEFNSQFTMDNSQLKMGK
jgi:type I restriction enzyme S subunit